MKYVLVLMMLFMIASSHAVQAVDKEQAARELAETMGISGLLRGVMDQTRTAVDASMAKVAQRVAAKYPDMTDDQRAELTQIFAEYTDAVLSSIDTDHAAYIYMSVIVDGLSEDEIEGAKEFYQSEGGHKTMNVVANAAQKLNEYVMQQMSNAQETAMQRLSLRVQSWQAQVSSAQ
ncbi:MULTISPECIES: DUF2059 domain-containing protein [Kordiimonas]|mgnify:CR=1 FL=1|jgi:hypothetical protein|uniref:DUF2059 domain-containing protein n=1 Tax=Kordiimonas TaxID=288021 RepID=UPI002580BD47|nr:DUF2059 domain-containing protein [Kordiimonas sp. UBA4487]